MPSENAYNALSRAESVAYLVEQCYIPMIEGALNEENRERVAGALYVIFRDIREALEAIS